MRKLVTGDDRIRIDSDVDGKIEATLEVPPDDHGLIGRACVSEDCSPGYFKIRLGTGLADVPLATCPYCRAQEETGSFLTDDQARYAQDVLLERVQHGILDQLSDSFASARSRTRSKGFLSVDMKFERGHVPRARIPVEELLRRDVTCPSCGLHQAVFGLARWCFDCGQDIFLTHVDAELSIVRSMLSDVPRRQELLGLRVAGKDLENCLEDVVSIFEAVLRLQVRDWFVATGVDRATAEQKVDKAGNTFQNLDRTVKFLADSFGVDIGVECGTSLDALRGMFDKRHPIAHNLGVVDRKFLERGAEGHERGKEVLVTASEVEQALAQCGTVFRAVQRLRGGVADGVD